MTDKQFQKHSTKLTWEKVREIRALKGMSYKEIASMYDVKPEHVGRIIRKNCWRQDPEEL